MSAAADRPTRSAIAGGRSVVPSILVLLVPIGSAAPANDGALRPTNDPASVTSDEQRALGRAPDGEPGFGEAGTRRAVERFLRSDEGRALVRTWHALDSDVRVSTALATDRYRTQGYFELLEGGEPQTLERLHAFYREREARAAEILGRGRTSSVLARMLLDTRFRARIRVLSGLDVESSDLRGGLALLAAELDGHVRLTDDEVDAIGRRVDLAASRLRAARLDLEALRERAGADAADPAWAGGLAALLAAAREPADLERELARLARREASLAANLFTERQARRLGPFLAERDRRRAGSAVALPEVRMLVPESASDAKVPPYVEKLPKHRRCELALLTAERVLRDDPLEPELNWLAGAASDFLNGSGESRRWFDRYLALRGIRAHDDRTYRGRKLSREEQRALDAVQGPTQPPVVPR